MEVMKVNRSCEADHFWNSVKIYYQHPKSINKQVLFSEHVFAAEFQSRLILNECQTFFNNLCIQLPKKWASKNCLNSTECSEFNVMDVNNVEEVFVLPNRMYLLVRRLIPKSCMMDNFEFFEFIFLDKIVAKVYIFTKCISKTPGGEPLETKDTKDLDLFAVLKYSFLQLAWTDKNIEISYNKDLCNKGITWLQATFASKFEKLLLNAYQSQKKSKSSNKLEFESKVDIIQYYKLYEKMKLKYAKYFVENWSENTDPKKFVYEDIGIATYLLMLWNGGCVPGEDSKKQKFLDLGCGNGLLVHILNSEGHLGVGLDMRKRKIWDIYPCTTVLREEVIIPTNKTTFPEADWLIGNHSDELTAWIPIMARLSNTHCQYFVLPCCPYQLNGRKFQRKNSGFSSYQDFINYVKEISGLCQFETYIDKLRIPSTKRICLIGLNNCKISDDRYPSTKEDILKFVEQECQSYEYNKNSENHGSLNFKVRETVDPVRNCTKLPIEFVDRVLKIVMNELLKVRLDCTIIRDGKSFVWNRGRKLQIREIASCLNRTLLQQLKNECKGLQTLLKNHHFLFEVGQGFVQFRSPESMLELCNKFLETQSETKWKLRKCWFFYNHPDKCPLNDDMCSYSHDYKSTQM